MSLQSVVAEEVHEVITLQLCETNYGPKSSGGLALPRCVIWSKVSYLGAAAPTSVKWEAQDMSSHRKGSWPKQVVNCRAHCESDAARCAWSWKQEGRMQEGR